MARRPNGSPFASLRDVIRDGYPDLVLDFDRRQLVTSGDLGEATEQLVLLGTRIDGRRVRGVAQVTATP